MMPARPDAAGIGAMRCPCGTAQPIRLWRSGSKSFLYRLRCPTCGRRGSPATTDFAKLTSIWNETVAAEKRRGKEPDHEQD
ncbi:MAG TPA: hypothetical protein VJQ81_05795 [Reyranella sp.]|nr:hypothetical protein [Reyranella sp.]